MNSSHKKCERCGICLAVYQLALKVGYEAVCCGCLAPHEKREIDQHRREALEAASTPLLEVADGLAI